MESFDSHTSLTSQETRGSGFMAQAPIWKQGVDQSTLPPGNLHAAITN